VLPYLPLAVKTCETRMIEACETCMIETRVIKRGVSDDKDM